MIIYVYAASIVICTIVFGPIVISMAVKRFKIERKKKRYTEKANKIIDESPLFYDRLRCNDAIKKQDNIDLAILQAILNNSDLSDVIDVFGISIDSLRKAANYEKMEGSQLEESLLKDSIRRRVEELVNNECGKKAKITPSVVFLALEFQSKIVNDVVGKAMYIEDHGGTTSSFPDDKKEVEQKEYQFYDHGYPEDSTLMILKKAPK